MASPKLSKLEFKVMDALWKLGAASVREIQEHFPEKGRPAYTTVQTILYRLEAKEAVRRTKKISNAHIFETVLTRKAVYRRAVNDLLSLFDGHAQPLVSHLIDSGQLTLGDIDEARKTLRRLGKKE
jgi:predicted transcriptional regulator